MRAIRYISGIIFITSTLFTCVKTIDPDSIIFEDALVVDALLTNEFKKQEVTLSRTYPINQETLRPEEQAKVRIDRDDGIQYEFIESEPGKYLSETAFESDPNHTYILSIVTSDRNEFQSDEVRMTKATPIEDIDVFFKPDLSSGEGTFSFTINSAKPETSPGYFRWKWTETYKVQVPKPSSMIWDGTNLIRREDPRELQYCYTHNASSSVLVAASNLESGAILNYPLTKFHSTTQKLAIRYTIEAQQMTIDERSYNFWELIRRNSEEQGSLFDSQPGTIQGNMHAIGNTSIKVLGIFEACEVSVLRKFYNQMDFFDDGYFPETRDIVNCENESPQKLDNTSEIPALLEKFGDKYIPWYISTGMVDPPGILFVSARCGDCRLYGSIEKPDFWID